MQTESVHTPDEAGRENQRSAAPDDPEDPYVLRPEDVREPPKTLRGTVGYLGPGMVLSAAVVGSGELITTTSLGAKAGFVLLWLVIISTLVKVWVQMELASWAILTGRTAIRGYSRVGPRLTRRNRLGWINCLWILMDFAKSVQRGGMIGGTAGACSILLPLAGEPLGNTSLTVWALLVTLSVIALLYGNKYATVERIAFGTVVLFTLITVGLALSLPWTEFAYTGAQLGSGLEFAIPAGTLGLALAMFGITGVGSDEMTTYTYWCLEKGYARWTGPDDGSEERARRAEGWLRVMRIDSLASWGVCTLCTLGFYVIGAAVLHPQGLVPEGNQMITTLSRLYTDTLGPWAMYLFLAGAIAVLYSTILASAASTPRQWTDILGLLGALNWYDTKVRQRVVRVLTVLLPLVWMLCFLFIQEPVLMVQIGGLASGIFLLAVVVAVWHLRTGEVPRRFRRNRPLTAALVLSSAAIAALGVYTVLEALGLAPGA